MLTAKQANRNHFMHRFTRLLVSLLLSLVCWWGWDLATVALAAPTPSAQATITDLVGSQLQGQVSLFDRPQGLQIEAQISGAPPGLHGFHIHEGSSCAQGGNAAKGHFNPDQVPHGKLTIDGFRNAHAGDLGNILIGTDGSGTLSQTIPGLTLTDGKYAVVDRAIILHANRDDFSQPVGNAGGRIGCGQIALRQPV